MKKYKKLQDIVLWSMLITICGSLITGSVSFTHIADIKYYWAFVTTLGTAISIYNVAKSPSDRRFSHLDVERAFSNLALECENFTNFAVHAPGSNLHIDKLATELHSKYMQLMQRTGIEHREYGHASSDKIQDRLDKTLKAERMIKDGPTQHDDGTTPVTT